MHREVNHLKLFLIIVALVLVACILASRFVRKNKVIIAETLEEVNREMIERRVDTSVDIDRISEVATLTRKYIREEYKGTNIYYVPTLLFRFDNQSEVVLSVGREVYDQLEQGESNTLTVRYGEFESFGAEVDELEQEILPFLLEGFDDLLDQPINDAYEPEELFAMGESVQESEEETHLRQLYEAGKALPVTRLYAQDTTDHFFDYSALNLIRISGMPTFLRRESAIQNLYIDCFKAACYSFATHYKKEGQGTRISTITRNGNTFTLSITLLNPPNSNAYTLDSSFFINTNV